MNAALPISLTGTCANTTWRTSPHKHREGYAPRFPLIGTVNPGTWRLDREGACKRVTCAAGE